MKVIHCGQRRIEQCGDVIVEQQPHADPAIGGGAQLLEQRMAVDGFLC
ncbi:MAG: hypothetical protein LH466_07050 [Sphingomonas bacterium]|nr:hypothetical protein [Sphingomonas bacterium]